jgi:hypothetical protein
MVIAKGNHTIKPVSRYFFKGTAGPVKGNGAKSLTQTPLAPGHWQPVWRRMLMGSQPRLQVPLTAQQHRWP